MHIIIIGAGIGGLAAGVALQQAGYSVALYEQSSALQSVGAGLILWPNALKALASLGLLRAVQQLTAPSFAGTIYSPSGSVLLSMAKTNRSQPSAALAIGVARSDLQRILLASVPTECIYLHKRCVHVSSSRDGVEAHFADGSSAQGDILIGADGLDSVVRRTLFPKSIPHYAGYTAWRGLAFSPHTLLIGEMWGAGSRFGQVALPHGFAYWFAVMNASEKTAIANTDSLSYLLAHFSHWHPSVGALLRATDASAIVQTPIYDCDPLPYWSKNYITLLGDAAHPMTPNLGQGACQALEDAVVLSQSLQQLPNSMSALHQYERRRLGRANALILQSRRVGSIAQWEHPIACSLRTFLLRATPRWVQRRALAHLLSP